MRLRLKEIKAKKPKNSPRWSTEDIPNFSSNFQHLINRIKLMK